MGADSLLDFDLLDAGIKDQILAATPSSIGPLVELAWLKTAGHEYPDVDELTPTARAHALLKALRTDRLVQARRKNQNAGFIRTRWSHEEAEERLYNFCSAAQAAAISAGMSRGTAQQLVGAIGELEDNIHLHSGKEETGLIGFSAVPGAFEFVIADAGVGVLASLRSCPDYRSLPHEGAALLAAIKEGASRFGRTSNHAHGFRQLFVGLYNLNALLRFRSGDYSLILDSRSPGQGKTQLTRVNSIQGFLTSVICQPPN